MSYGTFCGNTMKLSFRSLCRILPFIGIVLLTVFFVALYRAGILTDSGKMASFIEGTGLYGPVVFFLIQVIQVVIPIIPGGISCLCGVLLFGPVAGFILNYLGICCGSVLIFLIARRYGRPLLDRMFSSSLITRYDSWMEKGRRFEKLFAAAIFFPFAPDDFLCALAGTTEMHTARFVMIIVLGKPVSILLYSAFLAKGWSLIVPGG